MPGERYFGNTLSDLQSALTARDRLAAEQNIASQGNTVKFTQGMQQMATQRAALQQQAIQQAQANQLAQQQAVSSDYFNRGRLTNEQARIAAELEAAKAQNASTAAWREAQMLPRMEKIAADTAADAQATALLATQSENLAKARTEHDRLTSDLAKIVAMETAQAENAKLPKAPGMFARSGLRPDLYEPGQFRQEATTASGRSLGGINFAGSRQKLEQQLAALTEYIKGNGELNTTLTPPAQPGQPWVSALRPGTNAPGGYFAPRSAGTTTQTNGAPTGNLFRQGTGTMPPPAENRDALIQKIVADYNNGKGIIDRATAEQGLRALGIQ